MNNFEYIDIHSHLNFPQYDADRETLIASLKEKNIGTITIGTGLKTSQEAVELAEKHENLYATLGLHPADDSTEVFSEAEFEKLVTHPKVVGIGECGLDYARLPENPAEADAIKFRQKIDFEKQIAFAVKHGKPLMIHCREAYADALSILADKKERIR